MSSAASTPPPEYLIQAESLRLNEGQWAAYESTGNCVVLAGPGSGKTKTLTVKAARMAREDVRRPRGLACLTFSNECVREIKNRLDRLGVEASKNIFVGTVHGFCLNHVILPFARLAGIELPVPLKIVSNAERYTVLRETLRSLNVVGDVRAQDAKIQFYRRTRLDRGKADQAGDDELTAAMVERYEELLRGAGLIDFEDVALLGLKLIENHEWVRRAIHARFPILVVDEYQDLGAPLHRMVMRLCFTQGVRLFAVGDPAQSVYGFAGAKPELLMEIADRSDVERVDLKLNYRCGRKIVAGSLAVLQEDHDYRAANDHEGVINFHEVEGDLRAQADYICQQLIPSVLKQTESLSLGDIAVLYNNYRDAGAITDAAKDAGLAYRGGNTRVRYRSTPFSNWVEDCAAWCAGGWRTGNPRLSSLIRYWLYLTGRDVAASDRLRLRRVLVNFLWGSREPEKSLMVWFEELKRLGLADALGSDPLLTYEAESAEEIESAIADAERLGNFSLSEFGSFGGSKELLNLATLHSSKGLEFEVVIMMNMNKDQIPRAGARSGETFQARRVFYVGLTRAKREVNIVYSGSHNVFGVEIKRFPSEFVEELRRVFDE